MSLSGKITLFKRWYGIATGKNRVAVKQDIGKVYSLDEVEGYYNDLTGKVNENTLLDNNGIPINVMAGGNKVYFPISIFQYALGLYDLYLINKDELKKEHFLKICDWIFENQQENGSWDCFSPIGYTNLTVSSMGQGEAISVLARAYKLTKNEKWLVSMKKAIFFMIVEVKDGGTLLINETNYIFEEYPSLEGNKKSVLNGWIFSLFGIYDYLKINPDKLIENIFINSVNTLKRNILDYDNKYWSLYDQSGRLASPAYHDLHISLLLVLSDITKDQEFERVAIRWKQYSRSKLNKFRAVFIKVIQKLGESPEGILIK